MRIAKVAGLFCLILAESLAAQEGDGPRGLRRQADYFGLWPFWSQEVYESGAEQRTALLGLFKAETEPDGDWHHHLLPLYCASLWKGRTEDQFALYPLLYLRRRSPESDHDVILPLFYSWRSDSSRHTLLWPIFHWAQDPEMGPYRWIPVLHRMATFGSPGETFLRLGIPAIFEIFERRSSLERTAWTIATALNFDRETLSGISLARFEDSPERGREASLFPLFWARDAGETGHLITPLAALWRRSSGRRGWAVPPLLTGGTWDEGGHDVHALWPFLRFRDDAQVHEDRVLPFYWATESHLSGSWSRLYSVFFGRVESEEGRVRDDYYPTFLSHFHTSPRKWGVDVLWPLGCYYEETENASLHIVRALPFYDRRRNSAGDWMGVGAFLYRRHETFGDDSLGQWAPWPIVHWSSSPQGHLAWVLPFFFHSDESGETLKAQTTMVLPCYFSSQNETECATKEGTVVEISTLRHFWPFWGTSGQWRGLKGERSFEKSSSDTTTYSTLYPLFQYHRGREEPSGHEQWSLNAPWPIVHFHGVKGSFDSRLFPSFYVGSAADRNYLYLYPALSVEHGPGAESNFWGWTSIFQWYSGHEEQRFSIFPLLLGWREREDRSKTLMGPLYLFYWSSNLSPPEGWFHFLPLAFYHWSLAGSGLGVFPFYYQRDHGAEPVNYWNPARFFFAWNSLANEEESHWSFLWQLLQSTRRRNGDSDFRILHRFVVKRKVEGQRELTVNPFYSQRDDERTGRSSLSVLKFFFRYEADEGGERASVLFLPVWSRKR